MAASKVELYRIRVLSIREYGSFAIFDRWRSTWILLQKDSQKKYPDTTMYPIPTWEVFNTEYAGTTELTQKICLICKVLNMIMMIFRS